jgi:uncharacterized membrane protein (UPF0127 family)
MAVFSSQRQAFNLTRQTHLATALALADTHWTRLRGLLGLRSSDFRNGSGLWIVPCHGVHTLGMGFPIDVVYLDRAMKVIHVQSDLRPWRFAPVRTEAASVLELPSHTAADTRTAVGDKIEITINQVTVNAVTVNEIPINELLIEKDGRVPTA